MKKKPTDTIPAPPPVTQAELDTQKMQFHKKLMASCQESLSRSNKDTSWWRKVFTRDNLLGGSLFALVWLCGGFFRFLQIQDGSIAQRLKDSDLWLFQLILLLFLLFFISALNAPWKVSRNIPKMREFQLVSLLMILEFALVFTVVQWDLIPTDNPWHIITAMPLALFPALLINILDSRTAVCTAALEAILLPLQLTGTAVEAHYRIFCFALMISISAIPLFRNISVRVHYITQGLLLGFLISVVGLIFYFTEDSLSTQFQWREILRQTVIPGLVQGILTGFACLIGLPVLERTFHLKTPLALAELTDVNAPLLQRLRNEAPGTYQHSLDVAEMATNAASLIGADAKLVHVMGLYHDVGKLFAPQYFAENMNGGLNPLENSLRPEESADLIFEHVNHGVQLARKYKLSHLIVPAIRQHHGNTMLEHFYRKACDLAKTNGLPEPTPDSFRYPQIPTESREVAILSLADGCEAAVRALLSAKPDLNALSQKIISETQMAGDNATAKCAEILTGTLARQDPGSVIRDIDKRIASVIDKRLEDHQLDRVDLTTRELAIMARSFRDTILFHFHTRPEYRQK